MTKILDLSAEERWAMREAIEAAGAIVLGYGDGMSVGLPNPAAESIAAIERSGYRVRKDLYYFPLGSDQPPDTLRHACLKYGDVRGFWLFATVEVCR